MSNWDEDSPALWANLTEAMALLEASALARNTPSLDQVKAWHSVTMQGLEVPDPSVVGNFRGDALNYLAQDAEGTKHGFSDSLWITTKQLCPHSDAEGDAEGTTLRGRSMDSQILCG